LKNDYTVQSN